MRSKLAFVIAAALIVCLVASIGRGSEKFYYGSFHVQALPQKLQEMKDSLRFNLVFGFNAHNYIDTLANASLQIVAEQPDDASPTYWSKRSHYTIWEAEGYPGSNYGFDYTGGREVSDPSASGGKARVFERFRDLPGLIQTGPSYDQEPKDPYEDFIKYTAEFRLKSPEYNPRGRGVGPGEPLCSLKVVGNGETIAHKMVYESNFENFLGYKTFKIENYTIQDSGDSTVRNPIEFQVYWFGKRTLYIDYVKVRDLNGYRLIDDTTHWVANNIKSYVNQDWVKTTIPETGDTVVYRWYMRDEPMSIDCYRPYAYIDSILQDTMPYIPGAQFFCLFGDAIKVQDYLLRSDPVEYMIDPYSFRWDDSPSNYQTRLNGLIKQYYYGKLMADDHNKDFWVAVQAHLVGRLKVSVCSDTFPAEYEYPPGSDSIWCCSYRDPTP